MTPQELLDSLTQEQREAIADVIKSADIAEEWVCGENGSVCQEDATATLQSLAAVFSNYDPESALEP